MGSGYPRAAMVLLGLVALVASGAGQLAGPTQASAGAAPTVRVAPATATAGPVRMALMGDVHGENQVADLLRRGENPLSEVAGLLRGVDIAAVNLETPAGSPGAAARKEFVFLAPTELLHALRRAGVSVVSLANNHALDHGPRALLDTIALARAAGLTVVGAGPNAAAAYAPAVLARNGRRIAFVGFSRVVPPGWAATADRPGVASAYDEAAAAHAVRAAAARADVVVVLIHWGVELARCPGGELVRLAGLLHDAGADVVAGHHPHVLQGIDARADRVTAYSLGNFVWYHAREPSSTTGVLDVTVDSGGAVASTFHPARIGPDGRPRLLAGPARDAVVAAVAGGASGCWRG